MEQPRCLEVVKNQTTRWCFGNDNGNRHLFENPPQAVAFALDLSGPAFALGFCMFPSGKVVDDKLAELVISSEADRAKLDGYNASIHTPQCALDLSRRRSFGRQGF